MSSGEEQLLVAECPRSEEQLLESLSVLGRGAASGMAETRVMILCRSDFDHYNIYSGSLRLVFCTSDSYHL